MVNNIILKKRLNVPKPSYIISKKKLKKGKNGSKRLDQSFSMIISNPYQIIYKKKKKIVIIIINSTKKA